MEGNQRFRSLSRRRSEKEEKLIRGSNSMPSALNPRIIPTVSASETRETEPENSDDLAILEICLNSMSSALNLWIIATGSTSKTRETEPENSSAVGSASETRETEPENSSALAILEICGISPESDRRNRFKSVEMGLTASTTEIRALRSLACFSHFSWRRTGDGDCEELT
uniref:Uncharacterized protein LOC105036679 n=1 Tax=Elaeis guineensis var. tenera TaxID=51953 RepID=A0A6I9QM15_ELAGV|nr:uncharacterized protein LOC105036679 [Elaeis guineensis]